MRSILKLTWANVRHRRGSFKGIAFLMLLITFSFSCTVSNNDRLAEARTEKFEQSQVSDLIVQIYDDILTDEMLAEVEANEHVANVRKEEWLVFTDSPIVSGRESDVNLTAKKNSPDIRVFSNDGSRFAADNSLANGEIYLPFKLKLVEGFEVGAEIRLKTGGGEERFTVKGFYEDILYGVTTTNLCSCVITAADFERIQAERMGGSASDARGVVQLDVLNVDSRGDMPLSDFQSQLDRDTALIRSSVSAMTRDSIVDTIEMLSRVGTRIMLVFVAMLLTVILITMHNSIRASIEMEYTELGVLKSLGFTQRQISLVYVFQYIMALILGALFGVLVSIPACSVLIAMWKNITGMMTGTSVSVLKCAALCAAIILICVGFTFLSTSKISGISPVRAIAGGGSEPRLTGRHKLKIRRDPLTFFLALRQLNAHRRSYIGTTLIVSLLVFFVVTIMMLTRGLDTKSLSHEIAEEISLAGEGSAETLESETQNEAPANDQKADGYPASSAMSRFMKIAETIMNALTYGIYAIILSFAAVIVAMACKRAFITERTDIGIYKAVGFRASSLRMQFALRFAVIALLGSAVGCALSMLCSRKVLRYVLRIVGLTDFTAKYAPTLFLIPAALITLCCFVTAFLSAGRVKHVEVRELITE